MFGSEAIDEVASLARRGSDENRAAFAHGDVSWIRFWQLRKLLFDGGLNFLR